MLLVLFNNKGKIEINIDHNNYDGSSTILYRKPLFVIIGAFYNYMPVGANYLATELQNKEYKVIFLEQPTFKYLLKHPFYILKCIKDIINPQFSYKKITVISLVSKILPLRLKNKLISKRLGFFYELQDRIFKYQIKKIHDKIQHAFKNNALYIIFNDPFSYKVAKEFEFATIIFRVCDKYEEYPGWEAQREIVENLFDNAVRGSHILLATSENIYKNLLKYNKNIYLFPNAYQPIENKNTKNPKDIKDIKKPIIGFVGAINKWIDINLIKEASFKRPNYSFVIIGPLDTGEYKILQNSNNIYLLGYKSREDLPSYYKEFSVAIAPFKINNLTNGINPLKFYEYLAFGLPIVSTSIPETKYFNNDGFIYIAKDINDFVDKIDQAIQDDNVDLQSKRKQFAEDNNWNRRVNYLLNILNI